MIGGAALDPTGRYRYELWRAWGDSLFMGANASETVCWIMLNPSTADADHDDPTIRKVMKFSKAWGYGALVVVNLFAWRATDPHELRSMEKAGRDIAGPGNDAAILSATRRAGLIVCAWGNGGALLDRGHRVRRWLAEQGRTVYALGGVTGKGQPYHPLYLLDTLKPFTLEPA